MAIQIRAATLPDVGPWIIQDCSFGTPLELIQRLDILDAWCMLSSSVLMMQGSWLGGAWRGPSPGPLAMSHET